MRQPIHQQMFFGEVDIPQVIIDQKSRDDIPQVLLGLQHVYQNEHLKEEIFSILQQGVAQFRSTKTGRPGMELWRVFVLASLRLALNCDYDRLVELANNHSTLRQMLGHAQFNDTKYVLQTVKDNVGLLTIEMLDEINTLVVHAGHALVKKKDESIVARCDSFVVETNVHYPTDLTLLFDATRKTIQLTAKISHSHGLSTWRQNKYNVRLVKRALRKLQKLRRSNSKNPEKIELQQNAIIQHCTEYTSLCQEYIEKAKQTKQMLIKDFQLEPADFAEVDRFIEYGETLIDQVRRRIIDSEVIPHEEKIFSVFEEHTEWISKGKAGVPVELGVRVVIVEDEYGFILHHTVAQKTTDDKVAVSIIQESLERFDLLKGCSFDKGFHSQDNQEKLSSLLDIVVLPKKGKLSKTRKEVEDSVEFKRLRKQHSAVESAINALEVHGLDRCPDKGLQNFKRYIAIAMVARNLQKIGAYLQKKARKTDARFKNAA